MTDQQTQEPKQEQVTQQQAEKEAPPEQVWDQVVKDRKDQEPEQHGTDAPAEKADDPLAGLPEPTRKYFEGLQAKFTETEKRLASQSQQLARAHGTIGSLKQKLDGMAPTVDQIAARRKADEDAQRKAKQDEREQRRKKLREQLVATEEDLPSFKGLTDYIDLATQTDDKPAAKTEVQVQQKPAGETQQAVDSPSKREQQTLEDALSFVHPDWEKDIKTLEFAQWAKGADAETQAKINDSWNLKDASEVLTAFKKHRDDAAKVAQVERERQERLRRGESIQGRGSASGGADTASVDAIWNQVKRDRQRTSA